LGKQNFKGWPVHHLSNGMVQLFFVPEIGGRIIQAQLGPHSFLYVNPLLRGLMFPPEQNGFSAGWKN